MVGIGHIKRQLSNISKESWHYKLAIGDLKFSLPAKACTYYWWCLPRALGLTAILCIVYGVFAFVGWPLGYTIRRMDGQDKGMFHPYKTRRDGTKKRVALWEVATVPVTFATTYFVTTWLIGVWQLVVTLVIIVAALAMVMGTMYAISLLAIRIYMWSRLPTASVVSQRETLFQRMGKYWDRICPPLVVKD